jgi:hypothetical protein
MIFFFMIWCCCGSSQSAVVSYFPLCSPLLLINFKMYSSPTENKNWIHRYKAGWNIKLGYCKKIVYFSDKSIMVMYVCIAILICFIGFLMKMLISNLVRMIRFWNTLHQVCIKSKDSEKLILDVLKAVIHLLSIKIMSVWLSF